MSPPAKMSGAKANISVAGVPELIVACSKGELNRVEMLVAGGADVNMSVDMVNADGQKLCNVSAMYMAAQGGHLEVCKFLFGRGADPQKTAVVRPSGTTYTPADVAMLFGSWRTWWYLSRKNFVKKYRGSSIKGAFRSEYRDLDEDINHSADQHGESPLI